jgi:hypothetical protein
VFFRVDVWCCLHICLDKMLNIVATMVHHMRQCFWEGGEVVTSGYFHRCAVRVGQLVAAATPEELLAMLADSFVGCVFVGMFARCACPLRSPSSSALLPTAHSRTTPYRAQVCACRQQP